MLRRTLEHVFAVVTPKRGAARVLLSHVQEILVWSAGSEAAVLAHEDLGASLAVRVLLTHTVDLAQVRLQRASLRERFITQITPVRTDTCGERETVCVKESRQGHTPNPGSLMLHDYHLCVFACVSSGQMCR